MRAFLVPVAIAASLALTPIAFAVTWEIQGGKHEASKVEITY